MVPPFVQNVILNPSWWAVFLIVAYGMYYLIDKKNLLGHIFNSAEIRAKAVAKKDDAQDDERRAAVEHMIDNQKQQNESWMQLYRDERDERHNANAQLYEGVKYQHHIVEEAIEAMKAFVAISRLTIDKQDKLFSEVVKVVQEATKTQAAVGFILARMYFGAKSDRTFDDLLEVMEDHGKVSSDSARSHAT